MTNINYTDLHLQIKTLVYKIGRFQLDEFRKYGPGTGNEKSKRQYVSDTDIQSEEMLKKALSDMLPESGFYGEETYKDKNREYIWVVDPIDGTTNYLSGFDHWSISIALVNGYVKDPFFSCDGEKIVFAMQSDSLAEYGENLYTINYDGTGLTRITIPDQTLSYYIPQFTPDGTKIVYNARVNYGDTQIRMLDIASKQQKILVTQTNYLLRPVITPDGDFVIYHNIDGNIYKIGIEGNPDIKLTNLDYTSLVQISGDGNTLYFVSTVGYMRYDLFSMNLEGNNLIRVTNLNDLPNAYLKISSDGLKILNLIISSSENGFYIMNSNGTERRKINIDKSCWTFEFYPDCKYILFEVDGDLDYNENDTIYRINVSGSEMKILSRDEYHQSKFACFRPF